jgi:hypothetical protein
MKPLDQLQLTDFDEHKVWRFLRDGAGKIDYTRVEPVRTGALLVPEDVLVMVRLAVTLADGTSLQGVANVDGNPPTLYPGVTLESKRKWFRLMRPPAPALVLEKEGPQSLCQFLGKKQEAVFPIQIETEVRVAGTGETMAQTLAVHGMVDV